MTDPRRLLDEIGPGLERELLWAGRAERASAAARKRVAAAMAAAVVAPIAATTKAGAAGTLLGTATKWLAIGAIAGGASSLVVGGGATDGSVEEAAPRARALPAAQAPEPAAAPRAVAPLPPRVEPKPRTRSAAPTRGTVWIGNTALSTEAESLARVRVLARRDRKRALALLDQHAARFPHGVLTEEVRTLRASLAADEKRDLR